MNAAQEKGEGVEDAVVRLLHEDGLRWSTVPALQESLLALGPTITPHVFEILVDRTYPSLDEAGEPCVLDSMRELALVSTLERLPRHRLISFLDGVSRGDAGNEARLSAIDLAGRVGTSSHLPLLFRLATPATQEGAAHLDLQRALQGALHQVLQSDPRAAPVLAGMFMNVAPRLRSTIVSSLGAVASQDALSHLAGLLGRAHPIDGVILREIRRLALGGTRADENALVAIRDTLRARDDTVLALAISTLEALEDRGAVALLIEHLEHERTEVTVAAHRALCRLSSRRMSRDPAVWHDWYQSEQHWQESEAPALALRIRTGAPGRASAAIRELSSHVLFPDTIHLALLPALDRPEPRIVALGCSALGQLGSRSAIPLLIDQLQAVAPEVRRAANLALISITGLELPVDHELWKTRLQGDWRP